MLRCVAGVRRGRVVASRVACWPGAVGVCRGVKSAGLEMAFPSSLWSASALWGRVLSPLVGKRRSSAGHRSRSRCRAPSSRRCTARTTWRARWTTSPSVRGRLVKHACRTAAASARRTCFVRRTASAGASAASGMRRSRSCARLAYIGCRVTQGGIGRQAAGKGGRTTAVTAIAMWSLAGVWVVVGMTSAMGSIANETRVRASVVEGTVQKMRSMQLCVSVRPCAVLRYAARVGRPCVSSVASRSTCRHRARSRPALYSFVTPVASVWSVALSSGPKLKSPMRKTSTPSWSSRSRRMKRRSRRMSFKRMS